MIGPVMGHVGAKVSALIDGQLTQAESERLWAHVHGCDLCRAHVEREGWVKTRLACLGTGGPVAPNYLQSVLCHPTDFGPEPEHPPLDSKRRVAAFAVVGAGSMGVAMLGIFALAVPAQAPSVDRRGPATSLTRISDPQRPAQPVGPLASLGATTSTSFHTSVADVPAPKWVTITQ